MQLLYAVEISKVTNYEHLYKKLKQDLNHDVNSINFAKNIFRLVLKHSAYYDKLIQSISENWDISRMTIIDKILLRIGLCEFEYFPDIPTKVTINEMLDISKIFSGAQAPHFINAILDKLYKDKILPKITGKS